MYKCEERNMNSTIGMVYYCQNCKKTFPIEIPLDYCPRAKCNPPTLLILKDKKVKK